MVFVENRHPGVNSRLDLFSFLASLGTPLLLLGWNLVIFYIMTRASLDLFQNLLSVPAKSLEMKVGIRVHGGDLGRGRMRSWLFAIGETIDLVSFLAQNRTGVIMNIYWLVARWWCLIIYHTPLGTLFVHDLDPLKLSLVILIIEGLGAALALQNQLLLHLGGGHDLPVGWGPTGPLR